MNNKQYYDDIFGCLFFILAAMILMMIGMIAIYKQIDKLIEINTPEHVNTVPEKVILENK